MNKMKIRRKIIPIGDSQGIILDKTIMNGFNLEIGDILDVSDMYKVQPLPKGQTIRDIKKELKNAKK